MYIWTMVQIYKFFVKRKSDSHKKLRFRPILPPHLLLTPLIPRDFGGGWRGFCASTTRAMVGGFFWRDAGVGAGFSRLRRGGCFGGRYPTSRGMGGGLARPQPALWWAAFVEGCGGWR